MATFNQQNNNNNPFNGFNLDSFSAPFFADIDGDGDLDAVVGNSAGAIDYFRNNGSPTNPQYTLINTSSDPFEFVSTGSGSAPTLGDIDGDGNLELLVGNNNGDLSYYERVGNAYQEQTGNSNPFNGLNNVGYSSAPIFADLDGDGLLDLVVGEFEGNINYFRNNGTATSPSYIQVGGSANPFNNIDVGLSSAPTLGDVDGDGDLDAIVGEREGFLNYLENTGSATAAQYVERTGTDNPFNNVNLGLETHPALADVDGDGDLDVVVGERDGVLNYFERAGTGPNAADDTYVINLSQFGEFEDITANVTDTSGNGADTAGDGTTLTVTAVNGAAVNVGQTITLDSGASVRLNASGSFNYDPNDQFPGGGTDTFTYAVSNGVNGTDTATVTVILNLPPVAQNDNNTADFATDEDTAFTTGNVLANDSDPNGDTLTVASFNDTGTRGIVTNNGDGTFDYDPNGQFDSLTAGETATDTFTYTLSDGNDGSDTATVTITINGVEDAPVAQDDGGASDFTTDENTAFTTGNVLANDSDPEGDNFTILSFDDTDTFGTVTSNGDGTFNYDPNGQFDSLAVGATATDTFDYTIADSNGETATATVTITINGVNDSPVSQDDGSTPVYAEQTGTNNPFNNFDVGLRSAPTLADVDGDGDLDAVVGKDDGTLDYYENTGSATAPAYTERTGTNNPFNNFDVGLRSTPTLADVDGDGDLDAVVGEYDGDLYYYENTGSAPAPAYTERTGTNNPFNGIDIGYFSAPTFADVDGDGDLDAMVGQSGGVLNYFENTGSATAPAYTERTGTNNPFNGLDVGYDSAPTFADVDGDGDFDLIVGEYGGDDDFDGILDYFENTGSATAPAYTEPTGINNPFNFFNSNDVGLSNVIPTFADIDGDGDLDAVLGEFDGTLYYYENLGPFFTDEDTAFTTGNVLANDSDPEGDTLTVASFNDTGTRGIVTNNGDGTFDYDPNGQFEGLTAGETATDTFTYTLNDGNGGIVTAIVTITINGVNDAPVAQDDSSSSDFTTDENTAFTTGNVLANDSDAEGDTLTVASFNDTGTLGTVTNNGDGTFTYDPNGQFDGLAAGETATDTFTYTISDGNGSSDTAIVTITINGVNEAAIAQDDGNPLFVAAQTNPFGLTDVGSFTNPTFADIDNDGDLDAFVGEGDGTLNYFENTGTATSPSFAIAQSNPFGLTDVGNSSNPTFADINGDGRLDAFVGARDGTLIYFENTGTATSPSFAIAQSNPFGFTDIGFASTPTLVDIDGDGDLDALVGESDGTLNYFENTGTATNPSFAAAQSNPFGLTDVGFSSAPTFADLDGDGDLDAFIGTYQRGAVYFENTGTATSPSFAVEQANPFGLNTVGLFTKPTFADLDGDGALDVFIGTYSGDIFYFDNAQDVFITDEDTAFTTGNVLANDSDPDGDTLTLTGLDTTDTRGTVTGNGDGTFDYDPNGQFDGLAAGETAIDTFIYTLSDGDGGTDTATVTITINGVNDALVAQDDGNIPVYAEQTGTDNPFNGIDAGSLFFGSIIPTFADIDDDGDLDVFVGKSDGNLDYYENTGNAIAPVYTQQTGTDNPFNNIDVGAYSGPTLVDIDGDGDLDAVIGEFYGSLYYFENTGTATSPSFTASQPNPFGLNDVGSFSKPTFADIDNDGDHDAVVGDYFGNINYFENTGNATAPVYTSQTGTDNPFNDIDVGYSSTPTFVDVDGDGDLDLVVGEFYGGLDYYENTGNATVPAYTPQTGTDNPFNDIGGGLKSTPTFADIDGDGDLDAVVGKKTLSYFKNLGPFLTDEDTAFTTGNVLDNDSDPDGDILTVSSIVTTDTTGTVTNNGDGTFDYDPNGQFDSLAVGETATDTFTYTLSDGNGSTATATVTITINGVNDAPVAQDDSGTAAFTTDEDTAFTTGSVLTNDSDADGDTLTVSSIDTTGTTGTVTDNGDGTFDYDPNGQFESLAVGETATDTFTYTVSDGNNGSATATVTITINGVNDAPIAQDDGTPTFITAQTNPFGFTGVGRTSNPTFADIDGDGDLDAFVGQYYDDIFYFENIGTATTPSFAAAQTNPFGLRTNIIRVVGKPSFGDIDGDGDLDALVGAWSGDQDIFYFENIGTATTPSFAAAQTNPFGLTRIAYNSAPTLADLDGDGDLDVFVGELSGSIFYFENTGTTTNPSFASVQKNPFSLTSIAYNSAPTFGDIDGDGDLDAVIGEENGEINYFENIGTATNPSFAAVQKNPFGFADVGDYSTPTFADIDSDGDLDAFVGEKAGNINYFENVSNPTNTTFTLDDNMAFTTGNVLANDSDPEGDTLTVISIDTTGTIGTVTNNGDGTFDYNPNGLGSGATDTFTYTVSDSNGANDTATVTITNTTAPPIAQDDGFLAFGTSQTNPFGLGNVLFGSAPTLADVDGDGDLDAFVGEFDGNITYFENIGTATSPSFAFVQENPFGLTRIDDNYSAPTFADLDGDGDLDAFVGGRSGDISYFENTGTATSPSFAAVQENPLGFTNVVANSKPTFVDIDGDGDLDAFLGRNNGNTIYFENTGTITSPSFASPQTNPFGLSNIGNSADRTRTLSAPSFADVDGDGDLDAFLGRNNGNTIYFENTGTATSPSFASPQTNPFRLTDVGRYSTPTFADIDGDGDLDALVGNSDGALNYFENISNLGGAFTTDEATAFTTGNVLDNDSDPDGDTLIVTNIDTTGTTGTVTNNGDGTFEYDPNDQFDDLAAGETAIDTFSYTISDGNNGTATATVAITINGDGPPLVQGQPATIYVDDTDTVIGNAFQAGEQPYQGSLYSNTDAEFSTGESPDDVILGTSEADDIWGGSEGNDLIDAAGGNDVVGISLDDVTVDAGPGDDFVYALGAGGGTNTIDLDSGTDNFWAQAGNNTITGTDDNTLGLGIGNDTVITTGDGIDFVYSVNGGGGTNVLNLGDGDNIIWVQQGDYTITTGTGNDEINLGNGTDTVDAGDGDNIIFMADPSGTTDGDKDILTGNGTDFIQTGSGDDLIDAGAGLNTIFGANGVDTVTIRSGAFNFLGDFTLGTDLMQLDNLTFGELSFFAGSGDTAGDAFIFVGSEAIGQVANITVAELENSANFV